MDKKVFNYLDTIIKSFIKFINIHSNYNILFVNPL